jgi:hypothetical protein
VNCSASLNSGLDILMSHRTCWEIPRGRYDEHAVGASINVEPAHNSTKQLCPNLQ